MQGQLPRHTVATGCYGKELKSTSAMDFTKKLRINLVFPDVSLSLAPPKVVLTSRGHCHVSICNAAANNEIALLLIDCLLTAYVNATSIQIWTCCHCHKKQGQPWGMGKFYHKVHP